ncbi:AAA family ATPase [Nocardia tengchongensis]|uniref:AAA family ATPase n=1 Tax=Nocardia tengchongensis TaxID=2055889 RepID=UPI0036B2970D
MSEVVLIGRETELAALTDVLAGLRGGGAAVMLRGEPGVGKSVLLDAAARCAAADGMTVLRASGSEFEADVSYAALNQLLMPLYGRLSVLAPGPAEALAVALGFGAGPAPDVLLVCTAALLLLNAVATEQPVALLVDDIQWIDRASAVVLGFIGRRITGTSVGLLVSVRSGAEGFPQRGDMPELVIESLAAAAAEALLDTTFPRLRPPHRRRLLDLAQGNPLALLELPCTLTETVHISISRDELIPLNERLQALFTARISALPERTRRLLLLAAFEGAGELRVLRTILDTGDGLIGLADAERAQLVHIDDANARILFRHPLIRSAIVAMSTHEERRGAHIQLARAVSEDQERRAWHLAHAADGPDETVARLLETAAHRTMLRGDAFAAVVSLIRAAELSPANADRGRRLAEAAYIGAEAGGTGDTARSLLTDAHQAAPDSSGSLHAANAAAFLMLNGDGDVTTAHRLLVGAIETGDHRYRADDPALIEAMHTLLLLCWYGSAPHYWEQYFRALDRLDPEPPPILALLSKTFPDPVRTGGAVPELVATVLAALPEETDPTRIMRIGTASVYLDRLADSRQPSWRIVQQGRNGGPPRRHIGALMHLCLDDYLTGRWDEAEHLANEGQRVCDSGGFPFFAWYFRYHRALIAAGRGRFAEADELADEITHWARPRGVAAANLFARHPRVLAAMGRGDFEAGYQHAVAMSPPGVLASHVPHCTWVMFDLVESAMRTGRVAEAHAHVRAMRAAEVAALSPRMALLVAGAEVLISDDREVLTQLEAVLDAPDTERWQFETSRIRLIVGEKLRRTGAAASARPHLIAARDGFAAMNAVPWLERARNELRATGYRQGERVSPGIVPEALTPQEAVIARLAARGLTNKQIGEQLYLSHRTVGAHLYRIYPKLGVSSRAGLADALSRHLGAAAHGSADDRPG